jgi:hypothetical protein
MGAAIAALVLVTAETPAATTNVFSGVSTNITTANYWIGTASPYNAMIITNGAVVTNSGLGTTVIGRNLGANSNRVEITGPGSSWTLTNASLALGHNQPAGWNVLVVENGGRFKTEAVHVTIGGSAACNNNSGYFGGAGEPAAITLGGNLIVGADNTTNNLLILSNAELTCTGYVTVGGGGGGGAVSNAFLVRAGGTMRLAGSQVNIGQSNTANKPAIGNSLLIDAGVVSNAGAVYVGSASAWLKSFCTLTIRNGGYFSSSGSMAVGNDIATGSSNNSVLVESGGLLEVGGSMVVGAAPENSIRNNGGIFQFINAAPVITPNGFGRVAVTDGTIAFRSVTNVNIKGNWSNSLASVAFFGTNTFRLNNSTNAASGQAYTFAPLLGPTNYARLELVKGGTMYRGGDVTVGAGGSVLFSNTTASVSSNFTVGGTMSVADATVTFGTNLILQDGFTLNWSTNAAASNGVTVLGTLILPAAGTVNASDSLASQPARVVLFTQPDGLFAGSGPGGWTISDPAYHAVRSGSDIILTKTGRSGACVIIR